MVHKLVCIKRGHGICIILLLFSSSSCFTSCSFPDSLVQIFSLQLELFVFHFVKLNRPIPNRSLAFWYKVNALSVITSPVTKKSI